MTISWVNYILSAVLCVLQYQLWFSPDGVSFFWKLKNQVAVQQQLHDKEQARNIHLFAEIEDLQQGYAAIEERARSQLALLKQGETFYQVVEPHQEDPH